MHWDMLGVLSVVAIESIWTPRNTGVHVVELPSVANRVEMGENSLSQTDCDQVMRRDAHPYLGKQYLRNDDKKEVHDLDNEKTGANQCQIDEIKNLTMFVDKDEALKGAGGHHCMLKDDTD